MLFLDLRSKEFLANPGPILARVRAEGPLVRTRLPLFGDLLLTTSDEAARKLLKDPRFSRDPAAAGGKPIQRYFWWIPRFMSPLMESILVKDGEEHKRLRSLVDTAFAKHSIEDMRPDLAAMADRLLDEIPARTPVEIVHAYAAPLPLMAICAILGLPETDRPRIARWISPISRPTGPITLIRALPGLYRTLNYFRALFEDVRADPDRVPAGLIRELTRVEAEGDRLSENELLSMVFTLFAAGHVTTVHLISNAIVGLLDQPEVAAEIVSDPARLSRAVEEFMRFFTPVMMSKPHFAVEDLQFEGVPVRRGDRVAALLIGANHDPSRFDAPEEVILDRLPNAHLGFGHGRHVCLGMQLARIEAQVALERLFAWYPDLQLATARQSIRFNGQTGVRGIDRVPLLLRP